ncbi:MAG: hypothetical protein IJX53_02020 [Clostridia bacterium]|nr:hypothetical protein [Clostridia bacterium]
MKHSTIQRTLAALLTLLILLPITACASDGTKTGTDTTAAPSVGDSTTAPETADDGLDAKGYIRDTLDPNLNFNGETVTTLYWEDMEHQEFFSEGIDGEIVNDAIYSRNETIQNRLNVKLEFIGTKANASNVSNYVTTVRKSVDAGDRAYDILGAYSLSVASCAQNGLTLDLLELPHLNFDMPWWPEKLIEQAVIKDKLYFASGDISANVLYMMYVTFFNKTIATNYGLESPYDLVQKDEWTMDKMFELSSGVYQDLNGNGLKDEGDQFGMYTTKLHSDAFFWGSGTTVLINKGQDGLAFNEAFGSERTQAVLEKVCSFLYNTNDGYMVTSDATLGEFAAGHSLFYFDRARMAIRDAVKEAQDLDYGIVPIPKYDASQDSYSCIMGNPFTLYAIPIDHDNPEMAAAVMECMASESYRQVTPAVFETTLKVKYSKDEVSSQMLDIARDSVVFDLGRLFYTALNGMPTQAWENAVYNNKPAWIAQMAQYNKVIPKLVEKLNESFE